MNKPNYELKSYCIKSGQLSVVKRLRNLEFRYNNGLISYEEFINESQHLEDLLESKDVYLECHKLINSSYQKKKRLFDKIKKLLISGNCLFLTLTFTDDVLNKTNEESRRKYVQRFLKNCTIDFVANIDYGRKNEREHYHAVVLVDKVYQKDWKFGILDWERVRRIDSEQRLAKYITKLGLHAVKETCRASRILYSRKVNNYKIGFYDPKKEY